MDKNVWKQIEELFHQALELPVSAREKFVSDATQSNSQLRFEVLTLLHSHDAESGALEGSANLSDAVGTLAREISEGEIARQSAVERKDEEEQPSNTNQGDAKLIEMIESSRKDFVVKRSINRGGMGVVFRVYQRKLDRDVAVKVLSANHLDDRMRRRFIRESKAVAQIKSDHVVRIHEVCQDQDIPFLVMELIEGPTLKRYIELNRQVPPKNSAELARQIAIGLHAAHEKNLIHRDIKPANVLLEPLDQFKQQIDRSNDSPWSGKLGFRARVIDFGLARDIADPTGETQDQLFAGTLSYMSPEQITQPMSVDRRSDIYSLGMTLYQMLTGEKPFRGATHMVMQKIEHSEPTAPRKLDDRIPKDIESICLKALHKDRDRRYQSATEMAEDLQRFLDGLPTNARPIPVSEKLSRWVGRNRRVAALAGLAMGLMVALTVSSLIFAFTVQNKNLEIGRQTSLAESIQVQRIIDSDPAALLFAVSGLKADDGQLIESLNEAFNNKAHDFNSRFNGAIALSLLGQPKTAFIVEDLNQAFVNPAVCQNVIAALKRDPQAIDLLRKALETQTSIGQKARHIIVLAALGDFGPWQQAAEVRLDPSLCTEIIHQYRNWHGDLINAINSVEGKKNPILEWTFCHALSLIDIRSLNAKTFDAAKHWLSNQTRSSFYVNLSSARMVLEKWGFPELIQGSGPENDRWYELENGIRMVRIEPSTSTMGRLESVKIFGGYRPHEVKITRPFYIADTELTVRQFKEFMNDKEQTEGKPINWENSETVSPTDSHPVNRVSYYEAARFCNWLSRREGLTPVYRFQSGMVEYQLSGGDVVEAEDWATDHRANGYRLPNEHEWELACRDGTTTRCCYGNQRSYFSSYGMASNNTRVPADPVRSRLPNRIGIFDVHGNLWELCNDWHTLLDESELLDPKGPDKPDMEHYGKVHRGGGVASTGGDTDSEARGQAPPEAQYNNLGFRIARYADN